MYFPDVATLVATTTTGISTIVFWAFPVVGVIVAIAIGALLVVAAKRSIIGAAAKVTGVHRRGGRRGRRR